MRIALPMLTLWLTACGGGGGPSPASDLATASTYANFAQAFFQSYCVSCHPSASSARDFTMYSVIVQNSHNIACGVSPTALSGCSGNPAPSQFPIGNGPHPTDDERTQLVRWIQAGLPQ
jgi:hypothetical protein